MTTDSKTEDDIISYIGSISGETFSSRRRKDTCTLRNHAVDILAQRLREHTFDVEKQNEVLEKPKKWANISFHHYRFVVVMLGGISIGLMLFLRYNITVAILKMVNQTAIYMDEHPDRTMDDFIAEGYSVGGEFNWDNEIQHMIMSWYMIAYTLPQLPSTKLAQMVGGRLSVPISLAICAIATLLTPMAAYMGWEYVIGLRLINGLGASAVMPMMLSLVEHWMPFDQITLGLSCAQVLQSILTAFNPLVSGYLSSIHWSYAFYIPGVVTLVFCLIWLVLVTDRPDDNWLISHKELDLICGCPEGKCPGGPNHNLNRIAAANSMNEKDVEGLPKEVKPNYKGSVSQIARLPAIYAYVILWCCYCSSYSTFSFILPTYLRQFLKIGVAENGFYCFLIQSGCLVSILWPHPFLRLLREKFNMSATGARRLTYVILCLTVAATWTIVGAFHNNQLLLLFINRAFQGSNDIVVTGALMSNFAKAGCSSLVFSAINTVGNLAVVFASTTAGYWLDETGQSVECWSWIFYVLSFAQLLMMLLFVTFISADPIEFARKSEKKEMKSVDDIEL